MKCVIFDKDGTLLDFAKFWVPVAEKAVDDICAPYEMSAQARKNVLKAIGIGKAVSILGSLCYGTYTDIANDIYMCLTQSGIKCNREYLVEKTHSAFVKFADAGILVPTSKNLKTTLENLKNKGVKLFVVTADCYDMAKLCLEQIGILDLFDEILTDDSVHPGKPDAYYIEYIKDKYNFQNEDMCMIGDTVTDMKFAQNGKIKGFGVGADEENRKILSKYADATAENVEALFSEYAI